MGCQCDGCKNKNKPADEPATQTMPSFVAQVTGMTEVLVGCGADHCADATVNLSPVSDCHWMGAFPCGEVLLQFGTEWTAEVKSSGRTAPFSAPAGGFDCKASNVMVRGTVSGTATSCELTNVQLTISPGT